MIIRAAGHCRGLICEGLQPADSAPRHLPVSIGLAMRARSSDPASDWPAFDVVHAQWEEGRTPADVVASRLLCHLFGVASRAPERVRARTHACVRGDGRGEGGRTAAIPPRPPCLTLTMPTDENCTNSAAIGSPMRSVCIMRQGLTGCHTLRIMRHGLTGCYTANASACHHLPSVRPPALTLHRVLEKPSQLRRVWQQPAQLQVALPLSLRCTRARARARVRSLQATPIHTLRMGALCLLLTCWVSWALLPCLLCDLR